MNRIAGLEKQQAPWHLRWFYSVMRKMFGKDLTPVKQQMRVPGLVWGGIAMETALAKKRRVSLRFIQLGKVRTIPLFVGVGRVYRQGPMKVGGWVTGGPSFNDFEIDDQALSAYQAAGSTLEAVHVKTSWAFRPGVSASYDLSSWLALQGALSYTINRPEVHTVVDGVRTSETWNLDHSNAALGLVVGLF